MRVFRRSSALALCLSLLATPMLAQEQPTDADPAPPTGDTTGQAQGSSSSDRLFLNFVEDGTIVENQWWEIDLVFEDGDVVDAQLLGGQVAFQPWHNVELGARVAFGSTDARGLVPEGTGATDLDFWIKYRFPPGSRTEFTVGSVLTIPTGDEGAGLGADAFGLSLFGAMRYRFRSFVFSGNLGAQFNQDGRVLGTGIDLDGQTAPFVGAAAMFFLSDRITLVVEGAWRAERFEGVGDVGELLGGIDWHVSPRGVLRGAISAGVTDAAPNFGVLVGYAFNL
jgi:hypothetical protein